jgi:hypothetical protein
VVAAPLQWQQREEEAQAVEVVRQVVDLRQVEEVEVVALLVEEAPQALQPLLDPLRHETISHD